MSLKKADIEKFRKKLLALRLRYTELVKHVNDEVKTPDESKGYSQHQADEGTDEFYRNVSLQVTDEEYKILRQIDRALEKIDDNTYGICDISSEAIPIARLEAIPYATMTVKAQEMLEERTMTWKACFKALWVFFGILILDIVSKGLTHFYFKPFALSPHFFPFGGVSVFQAFGIDFCIHHVTNKGVAWGLGGGLQDLILLIRIVIISGIAIYMKRSPKAYSQRHGLVLILAGGLGNIIDYFIYGHVVDMFHFIFWGYSYPVFNLADTAIFFGIATLLWKTLAGKMFKEKAKFSVSKWLKHQVLLDSDEMEACLELTFEFYNVSSIAPLEELNISHKAFLESYQNYITALRGGEIPKPDREIFSAVMTVDPEAVYAKEIQPGRWMTKLAKPVIQLQNHRFFASKMDHKIHPMVMSPGSIQWGLQFAFPQIFFDGSYSKTSELPNAALFAKLLKRIRDKSVPTTFVWDGHRLATPLRLGKGCFKWIENHPQLKEQGISIYVYT